MTGVFQPSHFFNAEQIGEGQVRVYKSLQETVGLFDRAIQLVFEDLTGTPPGSPVTNGWYAIPATGTSGIFVGHEGEASFYNGTDHIFYNAWKGFRGYVKSLDYLARHTGSDWTTQTDVTDASGESVSSMGTKLNTMIARITEGGVLPG